MYNGSSSFGDTFKIFPIKTQIKISNDDSTDNFHEFQRIYGPLFTDKSRITKKLPKSKSNHVESRAMIEVKKIQLEMPTFGSESAIITPNHPAKADKKPILKPAKKEFKEQATGSSARCLVKKLSSMEHFLRKDTKISVHQTTSTILDITNKEIEMANAQLARIKEMIEKKQAETQTVITPSISHKKGKNNRHRDCHQSKYKTVLSSMKKKIKELENNYYKKPQIMYRSVNDTFTQFSQSVENISKDFTDSEKLDETLKVAISELENIVNTDITKKLLITPEFTEENYDHLRTTPNDQRFNFVCEFNQNVHNSNFLNNLEENQYQLFLKTPKRTTTPISDSRQSVPDNSREMADYFAKNVNDNFLSHSSSSSISPEHAEPKHVKMEHVLAKCWSGNHCDDQKSVERISEDNKHRINIESLTTNSEMVKDAPVDTLRTIPNYVSEAVVDNSLSKVIDVSEKRLSKYRHIKQDVIDINTFCDTLRDIVDTDDEEDVANDLGKESRIDPADTTPTNEDNSIFDESKLQESVMKSSYLMKEFNIKPKIFVEDSPVFSSKNKISQLAKHCTAAGDNAVTNLFDNLQNALANSIYTVDSKNTRELSKSVVV